jgi:hypothetical protein
MIKKTVLQGLIESAWSDYCDLDYFIDDMARGGDSKLISKHVMKMAMKHLRDDIHKMHSFLCGMEEGIKMRDEENDS